MPTFHRYYNLASLLVTTLLSTTEVISQCKDEYPTCSERTEEFPISQDLDAYYASTNGLMGSDLKRQLNSIINDHKRYNSYKCVWTALAEIDADDDNSDNVIAIYTQRSIARLNRVGCKLQATGKTNESRDAWNREHLWPKSHGFPKASQHAYSDLHHLVPADKSVNSDRSNHDFKDGGSNRVCDDDTFCCKECKEDDTNKTWEPPQKVKGQIARMMLYMDVRYEGNDSSKTPNLTLVDESTQDLNPDKDLTYYPELGYLSDLLRWHCDNPVTQREKTRNDRVQSWQKNRNPFIDRPEFAQAIWNDSKYDSIWENCTSSSKNDDIDASVWINEFHYDNRRTDINEFVEIGCNKEVDITGYEIVLINGSNGERYGQPAILSGLCSPPNQFVVKDYASNGIQNGNDGIALLNSNGEVVEFISYEGTIRALGGLDSVDTEVKETSSTSAEFSLQRFGFGCKGGDFNWRNPTRSSKGRINNDQVIDC